MLLPLKAASFIGPNFSRHFQTKNLVSINIAHFLCICENLIKIFSLALSHRCRHHRENYRKFPFRLHCDELNLNIFSSCLSFFHKFSVGFSLRNTNVHYTVKPLNFHIWSHWYTYASAELLGTFMYICGLCWLLRKILLSRRRGNLLIGKAYFGRLERRFVYLVDGPISDYIRRAIAHLTSREDYAHRCVTISCGLK